MAVTNESLLVDIKINTEKSASSVEQLSKQLEGLNAQLSANNKSTQKTEQSVTGFGATMVKMAGFISVAKEVYSKLSGVIHTSIGEYLEAEKALNKLKTSLALVGELSDANVSAFQDFAAELQDTAGVSDDLAISLLATAKNMGLTNKQAEKLVTTSADLAAVTGKDLESSFQGLVGTYKGQTRGLGEVGIGLKGMSDEALKAGKAVELLGDKFKGAAAASMDSFAGSLKATQNAMADTAEDTGKVLVESFKLQDANEYLTKVFKSLSKVIKDMEPTLKVVGDIFAWITDKILILFGVIDAKLIGGFQILLATFATIGGWLAKIAVAVGVFSSSKAQAITDFADSMKEAGGINLKGGDEGLKALIGFGDKLGEGAANGDKLNASLKQVNETAKKTGKVNIGLNDDQIKFLEELKKKNMELSSQISQSEMLQQDQIQEKLRLAKELLDVKLKELKIDGSKNKVVQEQLRLLEDQANKESAKAPSRDFEGAAKPLNKAAETISKTITGGLSGMAGQVTGMMSGAGAVMAAANGVLDFVQQIIDFIPTILEKIANIFDSLTDLPNKIAGGIEKLIASLEKFTSEFIPNLLKAIPRIMEAIVKSLENLPNILIGLFDAIPDLVVKVIDAIPDIVTRLVSTLVSNAPIIAIGLVEAIIKNAPKMIAAWMRLLIIELPKAFIRGVIEGAKKFFEAIKSLFSGKSLAKELFNPSVITSAFKSVGKALSGASSQLFNVSDLQDSLASVSDPVKNAVETIGEELWSWLDELKKVWRWIIEQFMKAWRWLWEKVLKPIIDALRAVWIWVYDTIIKPIAEFIQSAWQWVYDNMLSWFVDSLYAVWNWVSANVITPLVDGIRNVWLWVYNSIIKPIATLFTSVFSGGAAVFSPVVEAFQSVFGWVGAMLTNVANFFKGAFDGVASALSGVFNWVKQNIVDPLKSGFQWISDLFGAIAKLFEKPGWVQDLQDAIGAVGDALGFSRGGPVYAAGGMFIPKGTDTVPAMLTPGEYVVNKSAVQSLGMSALHSINQGNMPGGGGGGTSVNVQMSITTTEPIDERYVKSKLMPAIKEELRRASLDGAFLLSGKGIRS